MFNLTKKSLFSSLALLFILAGCGGESGTSEKSIASLTDAPTVNLSSSSYTVNNDDSIILSWSSTDTNSCIASGAWTGVKALEGSETIGPITVDGTYTLNCGGDSSTVSDSVNIVVSENLPPFPTISLQASPALVGFNGSRTTYIKGSICLEVGQAAKQFLVQRSSAQLLRIALSI